MAEGGKDVFGEEINDLPTEELFKKIEAYNEAKKCLTSDYIVKGMVPPPFVVLGYDDEGDFMVMSIKDRWNSLLAFLEGKKHDMKRIQTLAEHRATNFEEILDDQVMNKEVNLKETKTLIVGGGGVGKSHLASLLLSMKPPVYRTSTSVMAVPPQWLLMNLHVEKNEESYAILQYHDYIASMMMLGSIPDSRLSGNNSSKLQSSAITDTSDRSFSRIRRSSSEVGIKLLEFRCKSKTAKSSGERILGRIVDVGGQPQLLELLPRFISNMTFGILVIDLSQGLQRYPISYFYDKKGKPVGEGIQCNLTNEQIVRVFLKMIASQQKMVKLIFVGTHRELERQSEDSRRSKEIKIQKIISSFKLTKNVHYTNESLKNVIFAVNARTPEERDRTTAKRIIEIIMNPKDAENIKIPIVHHKLELTIKTFAKLKKVAVHFDKIYYQMRIYYKNKETMKAALLFLSQSFCIFYFEDIPDLVFGEPQLLLDLMTEITVRHIKLNTSPDEEVPSDGEWKLFKEQAIVSENILAKISDSYDDIFTPGCMLEVMEKLLIVCKIRHGEYLMPSLLTAKASLPQAKSSWFERLFKQHHQQPTFYLESDINMLVHFSTGPSPVGVFCGTVCELVSRFRWKLTGDVSRNRFTFFLPSFCGRVSLIDSFDSFFIVNLEVPLDYPSESMASLCTTIRDDIFSAIKQVIRDLKYTVNDPEVAFLCEHGNHTPHVTELLDDNYLRCTLNRRITNPVSHRHRMWLYGYKTNMMKANSHGTKNLKNIESTKIPSVLKSADHIHRYFQLKERIPRKELLLQNLQAGEHLRRIAEKLIGWDLKPDLLLLERSEVQDIKMGGNKDIPELQRQEALDKWRNKAIDPTYDNLLAACIEGEWDSADVIVELLANM